MGSIEIDEAEEITTQEVATEPEIVEEIPKSTDDAPLDVGEPEPNESVRDSVKKAAEALKKEAEGVTEKPDAATKVTKEPIAPADDIAPPDRFSARAKNLWGNLPKYMKEELRKTVKDLEGLTTKTNQELSREVNEIRGFKEGIAPFASKWASGEKPISWTEGVLSLARAQERLTNPETSLSTYVKLGVDLGHISAEEAQAIQNNLTVKNGGNPQIDTLQQRLDALEQERVQEREYWTQQQLQQQIAPIVEEMRSVCNERNPATGQFRYPELQNGDYVLSLRPRIEELERNDPTLSRGDALRKANEQYKAEVFGFSSTPQSNIRPLTSNDSTSRIAANAAVTVRGRTSPVSISGPQDLNPPPEVLKDARASARWAAEQLANRG